jgi:hypothetical protein
MQGKLRTEGGEWGVEPCSQSSRLVTLVTGVARVTSRVLVEN